MATITRCRAPLTCPSCGREFTGTWHADLDTWAGNPAGAQTCPGCGHVFTATWPGFHFEPKLIVLPPPRTCDEPVTPCNVRGEAGTPISQRAREAS